MAAPSGIIWGASATGTDNNEGKLGIYKKITETDSSYTVEIEIWIKTKWSVDDTVNTLYFDYGTDISNATSTLASDIAIKTTVNSSWSTDNELKIGSKSLTFTKETSSRNYKCYAKLTGVEYAGSPLSVSCDFTVPKRENILTVVYDSNGATEIKFQGSPWTNEELRNYPHTIKYGQSDHLANADNVDWICLSREGYALTGYWNTKPDGSGNRIHQDALYLAEDLAQMAGADLSAGDRTIVVYAEWISTSNFTPHVRIKGEWKKAKGMYVKTADGWKKVRNIRRWDK